MTPVHSEAVVPRTIGAIWAQTTQGVIGHKGDMPWSVPEDLAHFKKMTAGHPVIMGRRTWDSFPEKFRPLPGRTNIVLTGDRSRDAALKDAGAAPVDTLENAFKEAEQAEGSEEIWVIGGGKLYEQALERANVVLVTVLNLDTAGDTRAPKLSEEEFERVTVEPEEGWHSSSSGTEYRFEAWLRKVRKTK